MTDEELAARYNAYGDVVEGDVVALQDAMAQAEAATSANRMAAIISLASQMREGDGYRLLGSQVLSCDVLPRHLGELREIIGIPTRRDRMMTATEQGKLIDGGSIPFTVYRVTTPADAIAHPDAFIWLGNERAVRRAIAERSDKDGVVVKATLPMQEILAIKFPDANQEPRYIAISAKITSVMSPPS